jgi:MFS family permease
VPPAADTGATRRVVAMLAIGLFINYVDRGALPLAAHLIQDDLHLGEAQLGLIMSAFYWAYTPAQVPVGWLGERYGAHRVLAAGVALWAIATLLVGVSSGFMMLILLRVLLGLGESAAFPCASQILAATVPVAGLGRANGLLAVGYSLGPAFGTFVGGMLMARFGWQSAFLVFGGCSLLWLWPWLRTPVKRLARESGSDRAPRAIDILRQRALWGAGLGHFAGNYTFYFMLSWLPFYMVRERGYSTEGMGVLLSVAFAMNAIGSYLGGWAIDRWIARGGSMNFIYKLSLALSHGGAIACMLAIALGNEPVALAAIFLFQLLCGIGSPGVFAIPQIIAGERAAGRWVGIQNLMGNVSGMIGPWLTGAIVESTGHFQYAFFLGAGVAVLGTCSWLLILPRIQPIGWAGDDPPATGVPARA